MFTMFEAEFGDIKVSRIRIRNFRNSPTEENEIFVTMWDAENLLGRTIPKGGCRVIQMVKVPACCPNCKYELPMMGYCDFKDFEIFTYHGVTIKGITKIEDDYTGCGDVVELRIGYETLEYKRC